MLKWLKGERARQAAPEDPAALLDAGFTAHRNGEIARARGHYERVLALDPKHADALYLLGMLELSGGAPASALEYIDAAIAVRADQPAFHYTRGEALRASGQLEAAVAAFRRALSLDDSDADWWNELGLTLEALTQSDAAMEAYTNALARNPDCVPAMCNLANLNTRRGDPEAAIELLHRAVTIQNDSLPAHLALGLALVKAGDSAAAVQSFSVADHLARLPGRAEALIDQGITFERLDWRSAAERCYRLATSARPELLAGWINLSTLLLADKRQDAALAAAREAAQLSPDAPVARRQHALVLAATGDLAGAEEEIHAAIGLDVDSADSQYVLGNILGEARLPRRSRTGLPSSRRVCACRFTMRRSRSPTCCTPAGATARPWRCSKTYCEPNRISPRPCSTRRGAHPAESRGRRRAVPASRRWRSSRR